MRIKPLGSKDFFSAPKPPALIEGFITRQGITGLSGDPGCGKTFFAMEIVKSILSGSPFLNEFPTKRGSVLFVGQDCSLLEYAQQARKIFGDIKSVPSITWHTDREDERGKNIDIIVNPMDCVQWLIHPGINLANPADIAQLVAVANTTPNINYDPVDPIAYEENWTDDEMRWEPIYGDPMGVGLIVLDTLANLHSVNENSNDEMIRVYRNLRMLAEQTRAAILVLHHHSYGGEYNIGGRWRGASSQIGALDGHIQLVEKDGKIQVNIKKFRGIRMSDFEMRMETSEESCKFEFVGEKFGDLLTILKEFVASLKEGERFKTKRVVEFFAAHPHGGEIEIQRIYKNLPRTLDGMTVEQITVKRCGRGDWRVYTHTK